MTDRRAQIFFGFFLAAILASCGAPCRQGFQQCQATNYFDQNSNYSGYTPRSGPSGSYCPPFCSAYTPSSPTYPQTCQMYCGANSYGSSSYYGSTPY